MSSLAGGISCGVTFVLSAGGGGGGGKSPHQVVRKAQTLQLGNLGGPAGEEVLVLQAPARHFLSPESQVGQRKLRLK